MILASLEEIVATAPVSFLLGVLVGLVAASRYRIIRLRNGDARNGNAPP